MNRASRSPLRPWQRALLVSDRDDLGDLLSRHLTRQGLLLEIARDETEAEIRLAQRAPDIMILVVGPRSRAREFIGHWRQYARTPIFAIAVDGAVPPLLLDAGADDVARWPVVVDEFVARVKALLRRAFSLESQDGYLILTEGAALDVGNRCVVIGEDRRPLTPAEFRLLLTLGRQGGRICSARELSEAVWGSSMYSNTDALRALVKRLRAKLGGARDLVQVERGHGYRLSVVAAAHSAYPQEGQRADRD